MGTGLRGPGAAGHGHRANPCNDSSGVRSQILPLHHAWRPEGGLDGGLCPHGQCLRRSRCRHRLASDPACRVPFRRRSGDAAHIATDRLAGDRPGGDNGPAPHRAGRQRSARTLERPPVGALAGILAQASRAGPAGACNATRVHDRYKRSRSQRRPNRDGCALNEGEPGFRPLCAGIESRGTSHPLRAHRVPAGAVSSGG